MTIPFLALIAALVAVVWWSRHESAQKSRKLDELFAGRQSLDSEQFYDRYFRASGIAPDIVAGVRKVLEAQLGADLSRLAAEDDFSGNLGFFWAYDSMADVEVILALEAHFGIWISDAEAEQTRTISDLVELVAAKRRKENAA